MQRSLCIQVNVKLTHLMALARTTLVSCGMPLPRWSKGLEFDVALVWVLKHNCQIQHDSTDLQQISTNHAAHAP